MTREKAEQAVFKSIETNLGIAFGKYDYTSTLSQLCSDSLGVASLLLTIENEIDVELTVDDLDSIRTVESLILFLMKIDVPHVSAPLPPN